jgi:hypothetical protein
MLCRTEFKVVKFCTAKGMSEVSVPFSKHDLPFIPLLAALTVEKRTKHYVNIYTTIMLR